MADNIRIRTNPNGDDTYLKVNVEQDFDFIEILSLTLSQEDAYRKFCSDYGVVVGRVNVNSGFGVPNAKVSIFIPIDDVDKNNPLISGLYPYEVVTDKNLEGIRYNVLGVEPETNDDCFTPVGTFPTKRQVLDNEVMSDIYCKYYKFTTTTNHAGDYMIFGVPTGTYTLHVDVDISDIGIISQRPYDLINQGTSEKFFYGPTKFKGGTNLDTLLQIKSTNIGINVQPFWGDTDNCQIGITRADVNLNYVVQPYAIFMGSIFGDQHKHSINYRCRPRPKFGEICSQVTNTGTINMIRMTPDGTIEQFDVEGGRLIDENGAWAYLVPMNLENVMTNEYGELTLTNDPNLGIPTKASVRFKISMDETGNEGRLRTRASYLVPNNPTTPSEIDYNFDETALPTSFKDLYWNKIYTVSNFIPRYQGDNDPFPERIRAMTAIKNVDSCVGTATPFPYNRVNTSDNPIFTILCVIITIFAFIVNLINQMISVINGIIGNLNSALGWLGVNITCVPCIALKCDTDDGTYYYTPGCVQPCGWQQAGDKIGTPINYHPGDTDGHTGSVTDFCGWDTCQAFEIAKSLSLFQFDFYNDWVTGTLYSYLLKYKHRRNGLEKFCEDDCGDFGSDPTYSGVDGNKDGVPDNDCFNHMYLDTCYPDGGADEDQQYAHTTSNIRREGLVKKYKDEFFYASSTHDTNYKFFATKIVCLGSMFTCDWQGIPFLQPRLIPTTYKIPPDVDEPNTSLLNSAQFPILTTGMVTMEGGGQDGLFFNVNCGGLHVTGHQCMNIRHICEFGVDIDELQQDPINPSIFIKPDWTIGSQDIDPTYGKEFRDSFIILNSGSTTTSSANSFVPYVLDSSFNINSPNCTSRGGYDFSQVNDTFNNCPDPINGVDYINFRGYPTDGRTFSQPENSFFMYFGLLPGKTSLEKMNAKYFVTCIPQVLHNILITTQVTGDTQNISQGVISFQIQGGQGPYSYIITGPNGYTNSGSATTLGETFNNLPQGSYTITVNDVLGDVITDTIIVVGKVPLSCSAYVSKNVATLTGNDGEITVNIYGGQAPYIFSLVNINNQMISSGLVSTTPTFKITGLPGSIGTGDTLTITDSSSPVVNCISTGLVIQSPSAMTVNFTRQKPLCWNGSDGFITFGVHGGYSPYTAVTTSSNGTVILSSTTLSAFNLSADTYTIEINDSSGQYLSPPAVVDLTSTNPKFTIGTPIAFSGGVVKFNTTSSWTPGNPIVVNYSINNGSTITTVNANQITPPLYGFTSSGSTGDVISFSGCNNSSCSCGSNTLTVTIP